MKVQRLVSILMTLLDKKRISAEELAQQFEASKRTIYRDIDSLNMAGIPIHSTPGVNGGFEIMERYKVDNKVFSTNDLSTLLTSLSSLSNVGQNEELANAMAKIKSFIPADSAREIEVKANQIHIDLSPWMGNKNIQPYLEMIKMALQTTKLLTFNYTAHRGNETTRTIEPYQLVLKGNHWYVQGFCYERADFRLFKLSRLSKLQIQEESFAPREHQKPQLDFTDFVEKMQIEIKLRIHRSVMDSVLDYCSFDHFSPDGPEYYIVDFPFIENDFYYNMLFSFGDNCECLEPVHVRTEVKRRIRKITALYD